MKIARRQVTRKWVSEWVTERVTVCSASF